MTVWNIHLLNARHGLTQIMPEVRAATREAIALASRHVDLPRFDLVVRSQPGGGIPEWGIGGQAPAPGIIEVTINPERMFDPALLIRTLVHEMHHLIRWDGPGYGRSLGEALVSEGLAGQFVLQVLGGKPDPWDATAPSSGVARRAMNEWSRLDYDHAEWFFGKGKIRKWSGYGLGYRLISEYLANAPDHDAVTLAKAKADTFRAAMRQLAKNDGGDQGVAEATPTPSADAPVSEARDKDQAAESKVDAKSKPTGKADAPPGQTEAKTP